MINWKQKLTSRKWWVSVAAFVVAALMLFKVDSGTAEKVGALILLAADVVSYTLAESAVDAAHAKGE